MVGLLNIPENVMIQHIFPCLDHNDVLRLRRVSKKTKALADAHLWTPQPGHQGNWELKIDPRKANQSLEAFLQLDLPPPSRLRIINKAEKGPSELSSFFEDDHLEEFMRRYGQYVTNLRLDKLFIPFTSGKELSFYESLSNLEQLSCGSLITVGGAAQFEEKTRNAEGSFLIRPTFRKLKIFKLSQTDCMASMWNFINGVSNNLEELFHPFNWTNVRAGNTLANHRTNFAPVQQLIERRRGLKPERKLLYDWSRMLRTENLELLRVFACCRDNGVMIKNLSAKHLDCLLCDESGRIWNRAEIVDPIAREWIRNSRLNYERNLFVGNIIHSLVGVTDNVFLMEMPALEEIRIERGDRFEIYRRRGHGYPEWPDLKKMNVRMENFTEEHFDFLWEQLKRPKLEELRLSFQFMGDNLQTRFPRNLVNSCGNLKKISLSCFGDNDFFLTLWEGLPLLEDVTLYRCGRLTNKGFVGNGGRGSTPAFLNLKKLKHVTLKNLEKMLKITDTAFKNVFRNLKISSFTLSSDRVIKSITIAGIFQLLTGPLAEHIEQLNLNGLKLENISEEQMKKVVACFWSSKMR